MANQGTNASGLRLGYPPNVDISSLNEEIQLLQAQVDALRYRKAREARDLLRDEIIALGGVPTQLSIGYPDDLVSPSPIESSATATATEVAPESPTREPIWIEFSFSKYDLPPIDTLYTEKKDALQALNQWGLLRGYGFAIASGGRPSKARFGCDRRGLRVEEGEMKEFGEGRNKSSRGTGCTFSIHCIKKGVGGWKLEYRVPWDEMKNGQH